MAIKRTFGGFESATTTTANGNEESKIAKVKPILMKILVLF